MQDRSIRIISVDLQKDFSGPGGACYLPRPCVGFIAGTLVPYLRARGLQVAEIVSDYRLPRPGDQFECCVPGQPGYESEIPPDVRHPWVWVKCMNSPAWVRENGGAPEKAPGLPYPDPAGLSAWLQATVGGPEEAGEVVLIGLTLDCCVLCTAQELAFRGYAVRFLAEGVDSYNGTAAEKEALLKVPLTNWGLPISWEELRAWL